LTILFVRASVLIGHWYKRIVLFWNSNFHKYKYENSHSKTYTITWQSKQLLIIYEENDQISNNGDENYVYVRTFFNSYSL